MKNLLGALALSFAFIFQISAQSEPEILRVGPEEENAGRWFLSVTVAGGVPIAPALHLSRAIAAPFTSRSGGFYTFSNELNDFNRGSPEPTYEEIKTSFEKLKYSIAKFRAQRPGEEAMVVLSLTGHGSTSGDKNFGFAVSDGTIKGEELVQWILDLEADEVVLFVQSCQSGSLVADEFPNLIGEQLVETGNIGLRRTRLLVMTPAHSQMNSPLDSWEEVLKLAFKKADEAANQDQIVQAEELVNQTLLSAIQHPSFLPYEIRELRRLNGSAPFLREIGQSRYSGLGGIFPMVLAHNFPAELPLLLTEEGIDHYLERREPFPKYDQSRISIRPVVWEAYRVRSLSILQTMRDGVPDDKESPAASWLDMKIELFQHPDSSATELGCIHMLKLTGAMGV